MTDPYPMCALCGMPDSVHRLIRVTWVTEPTQYEQEFKLRLIVPKKLKLNDAVICEDCIRQIKRLPLGTLANNPPWDKTLPKEDLKPVSDEDLPF